MKKEKATRYNPAGSRLRSHYSAFCILHFSFCISSAEPASGTVFYHTSYPEASAVSVVGSPPRWLAVVDNEIPRVALFPLEPQATKIHAPALVTATSPAYAVEDLEACTVFPWDIDGDGKAEEFYHVFAGSCSRTQRGRVRPERDALFALRIDETAAGAGKSSAFPNPAGVEYNRTLRAQIRALGSESTAPWGKILRDSVWGPGEEPDARNIMLAGGGMHGLNIEALTVSKDARELLLGLRSPLVDGKALLIPVANPVAALGLGGSAPQPLALKEPVLLDLGGLGCRSIEWDPARGVYLVIAGSAEDRAEYRFFTWTGESKDAPVPVTTTSALKAAGIEPEGVTPVAGYSSAAVVGDNPPGAPYHKGIWVDFGTGK